MRIKTERDRKELQRMKGAYYTKQYRNVFAECGHSQEEIDKKLKDAFHTVFLRTGWREILF